MTVAVYPSAQNHRFYLPIRPQMSRGSQWGGTGHRARSWIRAKREDPSSPAVMVRLLAAVYGQRSARPVDALTRTTAALWADHLAIPEGFPKAVRAWARFFGCAAAGTLR